MLPDYLRYLIGKDMLAETYPVWERMAGSGSASGAPALGYVDYLISKGDVVKAKTIWDLYIPMPAHAPRFGTAALRRIPRGGDSTGG